MKTSTKIIATTLATLSLGAAGLVFAQQGVGPGMGGHPGYGMGAGMGYGMGHGWGPGMGYGMGGPMHGLDTPAVTSARLSDLKTGLKITADQEPAWAAYESMVRRQAEARQALHDSMLAKLQDPAAAANFDHAAQHEAMLKWRETQSAEYQAAWQALFAVLTPEQQTLAAARLHPGYGHHMALRGLAR